MDDSINIREIDSFSGTILNNVTISSNKGSFPVSNERFLLISQNDVVVAQIGFKLDDEGKICDIINYDIIQSNNNLILSKEK